MTISVFYKYIEILTFYNLITYSTLMKHLYMDIPEKFELTRPKYLKFCKKKSLLDLMEML